MEKTDREQDEQAADIPRHVCTRRAGALRLHREADAEEQRENGKRLHVHERGHGQIEPMIRPRRDQPSA